MSKVLHYPSTDQFRQIVRNVKNKASFAGLDADGNAIYQPAICPTLDFIGTVKLHGTNAAIRQDTHDGELIYQSREHVISPVSDNAGFATAMYMHRVAVTIFMTRARELFSVPPDTALTAYGEWCGGNIQKGVAISGLAKMFVIFAVRVGVEDDTVWYRANDIRLRMLALPDANIRSILDFQTWNVTVDFNAPENVQNIFAEITLDVEKECPVGKYFGNIGVGEGVVWNCATPGWDNCGLVFKVKGEKHSVSKVKTLAAVDVEKIGKIKELVASIMTDNRMEQMLGILTGQDGLEISPANCGPFIKLCMNDAIKEELDTIVQNGFDVKEFSRYAANTVRIWFLNKQTF